MDRLQQALIHSGNPLGQSHRVDLIETHISWLYLTDNLVFKRKKPVNFNFCDFTELGQRRRYCHEEVRLNRRLSQDIYLGVNKVVRQGDTLCIDQPGEVVDYLVRMRRLENGQQLATILNESCENLDIGEKMARLGRLLAQFHRDAKQVSIQRHPDFEIFSANWLLNFRQCKPGVPALIPAGIFSRIRVLVESFLRDHKELFIERQKQGFVRDGHGDLHCEHIYLGDPIQVIDCIEFNPSLRYADILCDLAFLTMDLRFRQRSDLAEKLWRSYQRELEPGPEAETLMRLYSLYRAWVRAKVHILQQGLAGPHAESAANYFRRSCVYALPPVLLICCGMIATGKSTLAKDISDYLNCQVLSSDRIRSEQADKIDLENKYSLTNRLKVYRILEQEAEKALQDGHSLVIDASCENEKMREPFWQLAKRLKRFCLFVEVSCSPETIRNRLAGRKNCPEQAYFSEAGLVDYEAQRKRYEPLSEDLHQVQVNTGQPREYNVDFLLERLLQTCGTLE